MKSQNKNWLPSTSQSPTTGKTTQPTNSSQSKALSNSSQSSLYPDVLLSTCSKPKRRRTTSSSTSAGCSSWTIAMNLSLNILVSLGVLLIHKICLLTFQENICNITKSLRLSRKTLPKSALNFSRKFQKTLRTTRSSLNNSAKISSQVSTKIQATEQSLLNSYATILLRAVKKLPALRTMSLA